MDAQNNPDSELIRHCVEAIVLEAEWQLGGIYRSDDDAPMQPLRYHEIMDVIVRTPARTEAGNRAKLAVVLEANAPNYNSQCPADDIMWDAIKALALPLTSMRAMLRNGGAPLHPDLPKIRPQAAKP